MSTTSEESVDQLPARVALLLHQAVPTRDTLGVATIKQLSAAALRMSHGTDFNDTVSSWIRNNPKHPHLAAFAVASAACEYAADDLLENTLDELASIVVDASTALKCVAAAALLPPLSISVLRQDLHVDVKVKYRLLYIIVKLLKDSRDILMARYELPKEILDLASIDASANMERIGQVEALQTATFWIDFNENSVGLLFADDGAQDVVLEYKKIKSFCVNYTALTLVLSVPFAVSNSFTARKGAAPHRIVLTWDSNVVRSAPSDIEEIFSVKGVKNAKPQSYENPGFSISSSQISPSHRPIHAEFSHKESVSPSPLPKTVNGGPVNQRFSEQETQDSDTFPPSPLAEIVKPPAPSKAHELAPPESNRHQAPPASPTKVVQKEENPKKLTSTLAASKVEKRPVVSKLNAIKTDAKKEKSKPSAQVTSSSIEGRTRETADQNRPTVTGAVASKAELRVETTASILTKTVHDPEPTSTDLPKGKAAKSARAKKKPAAPKQPRKTKAEKAKDLEEAQAEYVPEPEPAARVTRSRSMRSSTAASVTGPPDSPITECDRRGNSVVSVVTKPESPSKLGRTKTSKCNDPAPTSKSKRTSTCYGNLSSDDGFNDTDGMADDKATSSKATVFSPRIASLSTPKAHPPTSHESVNGSVKGLRRSEAVDEGTTPSRLQPRPSIPSQAKTILPPADNFDSIWAIPEEPTSKRLQENGSSSLKSSSKKATRDPKTPSANSLDTIWAIPEEPRSKIPQENEASSCKSSSKKIPREHKTPSLTEQNPNRSTQKGHSSRASKSVRDSPAFSSVSHPRRETKDVASLSAVKKVRTSATKGNRDSSTKKLPWLKVRAVPFNGNVQLNNFVPQDLDSELKEKRKEPPKVSIRVSPQKARAEIAPKLINPDPPVENLDGSENDFDDPPFEMAPLPLSPRADKVQSDSSSRESERKSGKSQLLSDGHPFEKFNQPMGNQPSSKSLNTPILSKQSHTVSHDQAEFETNNNGSLSRSLNTPTLSKHQILIPDSSVKRSHSKKDVSALTGSIDLTVESAKKRIFSPDYRATNEERDARPKTSSARQLRFDADIFTASELKSNTFSERLAESRSKQPHAKPGELGSPIAPLYKFSRLSNMPSNFMEVEEMISSSKGIKRTRSMTFSLDEEDLNDTTIVQEFEQEEDFERQTVRKRSTEKKSKTSGGITYASQMTQEEIISGSPVKKALMKRRLDMANDDIGQAHLFAPNKHARNFSSQHETADPIHDFMQQYMAAKIKTNCEEVADKRIRQARHHMNSIATIDASKALRDRCKLFESFASECSWSWRPCSITSISAKSADLIQELRSEGLT
ncbi:hypothetical protein HDU81_002033 [Chytriomyces hyalinus]|nr:hypothetical protein HDU81_002033 [Chytriomyces hyalinus]